MEKKLKQIQVKISEEDKQIINQAATILGLGYTSYLRYACLKEAREVILKNKIEVDSLV